MRIARTVLILLLVVSLPVSALGAVYGPMPCASEQPHTTSDRSAATDLERHSPHAHPAQPDTVVADNAAAGSDHAGFLARCTCGTDCDMTHCAGVNHTTAVIDSGHLLAVIATGAASARGQRLYVSAPPATLLRPPIAV